MTSFCEQSLESYASSVDTRQNIHLRTEYKTDLRASPKVQLRPKHSKPIYEKSMLRAIGWNTELWGWSKSTQWRSRIIWWEPSLRDEVTKIKGFYYMADLVTCNACDGNIRQFNNEEKKCWCVANPKFFEHDEKWRVFPSKVKENPCANIMQGDIWIGVNLVATCEISINYSSNEAMKW